MNGKVVEVVDVDFLIKDVVKNKGRGVSPRRRVAAPSPDVPKIVDSNSKSGGVEGVKCIEKQVDTDRDRAKNPTQPKSTVPPIPAQQMVREIIPSNQPITSRSTDAPAPASVQAAVKNRPKSAKVTKRRMPRTANVELPWYSSISCPDRDLLNLEIDAAITKYRTPLVAKEQQKPVYLKPKETSRSRPVTGTCGPILNPGSRSVDHGIHPEAWRRVTATIAQQEAEIRNLPAFHKQKYLPKEARCAQADRDVGGERNGYIEKKMLAEDSLFRP